MRINNPKLPAAATEAIERQRTRLFRAMALVETTEMSLEEEELSQRETLKTAYEMLGAIATKMELIGKDGTDQEDEPESAS